MGQSQHVTRGEAERSEGVTRAAHDRRSGQRSERGVDPARTPPCAHLRYVSATTRPPTRVCRDARRRTRRRPPGESGLISNIVFKRRGLVDLTSDCRPAGPSGPVSRDRRAAGRLRLVLLRSLYELSLSNSVVLYSMRGVRDPFRATSTRTYPHAHAVPSPEYRPSAGGGTSPARPHARPPSIKVIRTFTFEQCSALFNAGR
jgi:hypothetical protein